MDRQAMQLRWSAPTCNPAGAFAFPSYIWFVLRDYEICLASWFEVCSNDYVSQKHLVWQRSR